MAGRQQAGQAGGYPAEPASGQAAGWFEPGHGWPDEPAPAQPDGGPYGISDTPVGPPSGGQPQLGQPAAGQYSPGQPLAGPPATPYDGQYGETPYDGPWGLGQPVASSPGGGPPGGGVALLSQAVQSAPPPAPAPPAPPAPMAPAQPHAVLPGPSVSSGPAPADLTAPRPGGAAWPDICDQFGLHLLVLAEQLRTSLDELEADEGDPERLRRLYQVDHAVTRMRRASRDLRTLAGRSEEELAGFTTSLLDVIRMAASAIERYTQVTIGRVTDLAVLGYAADDVGALMAALLDNATRYSPGSVSVSGHLLDDGSVMFRIEDTGIGIGADQVSTLNTTLAGPVPDVDERTGRHTGFPVVHRIARKHSIGVRLASRPLPSSGTVAMVMIPAHLLCEVPVDEAQRRQGTAPAASGSSAPAAPAPRPSALPDWQPRGEPTRPQQAPPLTVTQPKQPKQPKQPWEPPELPGDQPRLPADADQSRAIGELPRRERASLRGDEPRPQSTEKAALPTPQQQAAARRAFADDLDAFSLGSAGLTPLAGGHAGQEAETADGVAAAEEEIQP